MTVLRLNSLPMHGAVELAAGLVALLAPFALGFGPAGLVLSVPIGVLVSAPPVSAHLAGRIG